MPRAKLFLIDAHTLCYRSYFAIQNLSTSKGQPTNAVYGFVATLRKILKTYQPDYLAVCFDAGKKTHRQEKFAAYKIQRPSMPLDLIGQLPLIKEVVKAYNLSIFEEEGFEADDIIATLAIEFSQQGVEVVIVSEDKDMYQLLNDSVMFFSARKDSLLDYEAVKGQLGFDPKKITDFIALAGDQSDNIPGVQGVGEVTARALINEWGSLEEIYKHMDKIKTDKLKEKLLTQKDNAFLSKELAVLEKKVPLKSNLESMRVKAPNQNRLLELFKELEFNKMAQELAPGITHEEPMEFSVLSGSEAIKRLIKEIQQVNRFAFLIGVFQEGPEERNLVIACDGSRNYKVSLKEISSFKEVFEDKGIPKITHDLKQAFSTLSELNIFIQGEIFDVKLAGYLLSPSAGSFDLAALAWEYLKLNVSKESQMLPAHLLWALHLKFLAELKNKDLFKLYYEMELPLSFVLFEMEREGVTLDRGLLENLSKETERKMVELTKRVYNLAGEEFNLNSPKQLSRILFEKLKLPVVKKTKTGFSTDEEVLLKLAQKFDLPSQLLEYRQLAKIKSTYIDALPQLVNPKTNRIHAHFEQTGTETGRLSSHNPNLQNIPIRTELGREIRRAIIPSAKNRMIISADYSQVELRILAHLSKDANLIKAFLEGQDIHTFTAALIFEVAEDKVTASMRDTAKRVNFGIIYGMSSFGLAKDLGIPQHEAQDFIDRYFLRYPKVKKFMEEQIEQCERCGFVVTILNRRRYIPEIASENQSIRQFAQRQAINTPVQGSAADLIKLAMVQIHEGIKKRKLGSSMIMTVHDELVFDALKEEQKTMVALIKDTMEHALDLSVPIKVSVKVGPNWLELKETIT